MVVAAEQIALALANLVMAGTATAGAATRAGHLREAVSHIELDWHGKPLASVTASFGVATYPGHADSMTGHAVQVGEHATGPVGHANETTGVAACRLVRIVIVDPAGGRGQTVTTMGLSGVGRLDTHDGVEQARRRELTDVLTHRVGLDDLHEVEALVTNATWQHLASGQVLPPEEPGHPLVWMVVLGRLRVHRSGPTSGETAPQELGRGGLVRPGTVADVRVTATRDTLLAGFSTLQLHRLTVAAPELLMSAPWAFPSPAGRADTRATVIAVVVAPGLDRRVVVSRLASGLEPLGTTQVLWAARVDARLATPGIAQCERGGDGDLAVARLLEDVQSSVDALVLEVGPEPDAWSRRALAAADRVAVVATPEGADEHGHAVRRLVDFAPPGTPRHLVLWRAHDGPPTGTAPYLDATACLHVHHVRRESGRDVARAARLLAGRGRGLVLGGGGARGFAHLGVHRALVELGVDVDLYAGSSIGSPLAVGMADGIAPNDLEELVERLFARVLDYTIPVVSLTSGRRIAAATAHVFGDRDLEDLEHPCACVSTDLTTSRPHVHRRGPVVAAVRASCAIPGVMPPVPHDGHLLVDGGVTDNLPVGAARDLLPDGEVIAVDVAPATGPRAREDYGLWVSGVRALRRRARRDRALPAMATTIMQALTVASAQRQDRRVAAPIDCHLQLDLRGVSTLDFEAVRAVARRGYDQAMPVLEAWLSSRPSPDAPGGGRP